MNPTSAFRTTRGHLLTCACLCVHLSAHAADAYKLDNTANLNLPGSWENDVAPTSTDVANWDSFVTSANSTQLGANLAWDGIRILNPAGPVTISGANTLSLGASGISLSTATQNLTLNNGVALTADQSWNSANGRRITASGPVSGAFNLTKTGAGELVLDGSSSNAFGNLAYDTTGGIAASSTLYLGKTGGAVAVAAGKTVQFGSGGTGQANLRMLQPQQFGAGVVMNFGNASGQWARFDLNGTSQTFAGLNAGVLATQAGAVVQNRMVGDSTTQLGPVTLTLNGTGTYLYNGYLRDVDGGTVGNNQLKLVKNGSGTQTLAGNQILYTGGTEINDGKLLLGPMVTGGTGTLRGAVTVNAPGILDYAGDNSFGYNAGVNVNALTINNTTVGGANFNQHFYTNFVLNMTGASLLLGGTNNEFHNTTLTVAASPNTSTIARAAGNTAAAMRVRDTTPMTIDVADGAQPVDFSISVPLITQNAGSIVTKTGPGTLLLTGAQDNASTILAAMGGTTILDKSGATIRAAAGISNIGAGATVRIAGSSGDQIYAGGTGNLGRVGMSGGTLDLAGLNEGWDRLEGTGTITNSVAATTSVLTLGENNGSSLFSGSINNGAGAIKLVKTGSGTLGLAGSNTLSGSVEVSAGTLALTGSLPSSTATVADGAGVAGEGSFSSLTLGASSGASLVADPATPGALNVSGALEVKGNTTVSLVGGYTSGVPFKLISFGSKAGTWDATNFTLANAASFRGTPAFTQNANDVSLTLSGANLKWNNAAGNLRWNTNTAANFHDGTSNSTFFWGDKVTFDDTPGAAQAILIDGAQQPASMTVNSQYDYSFASGTSGSLAGGMSLVKAGSGTLTISTGNSFLGSTTVNGGTLAIGSDAALGTAPITPTPAHLAINGGTLRWTANFNPSGNRGIAIGNNGAVLNTSIAGTGSAVTLASTITGNGPLTLQANGDTSDTGGGTSGSTLLTGTGSSFTGNVTITSGVVTINSNFGNPANAIVLNGGGLVDQNLNIDFGRNIQVGAAGGVYRTYGSVATSALSGSVSNAPGVATTTLRHTDGGTVWYAGDWSGFAGQYQNKRGNVRVSALNANWANVDYIQDTAGGWVEFRGTGTATLNSMAATRDVFVNYGTTLNVDSGVISSATNGHWWQTNAGDLGKLTSSSGTLTMTNGAASGTLATLDHQLRLKLVDFNGGTPLTFVKNGVNHLGVNQANTYSGGTIVNAGRFWAENLQSLGTGPVTVNNGGQVGLLVANASYANNFTIAGPGQLEAAGTLGAIRFVNNSLAGNVTVAPAGARITAHGGFGTLTGALLGSGNLEINSTAAGNNGTISLNGNSPAYTGTLTVSQGRLNVNGASFGGSLVAPDSTTLGGEASFAGNVTLGSVTGPALVIDPSTPAKLSAAGTLTVNGTVNVSLNGNYPASSAPIEVIGFGSKGNAWTAANFAFAAPTGARAITFGETANAVVLNIPTTDLVWNDAAVTATWNTNGDANFKDAANVNQPFFWGDRVTFNDLPGADQLIGITGTVEPGLMTVNSQYNYEFFGGMIAGGGIVKSGTGTLTLGQANSLTGPITLNGGKIVASGVRSGTSTALGLGSTARTITVNAGTTLEFQLANIFGNHNTTAIPALVVNGGTVTNSAAATPSVNNALNSVTLNSATLTSTTGSTSTIGGTRPTDTYGAWNLNGTVTSTGSSTITTTAPVNGQVMLGSVGSDTTFAVTDGTLTVATPMISGDATYQSGLVKTQPGTMVLTTASTYTGPTTVNGGTLLANNGTGSGTGAGAVTVNTGGKFGGTGAISGAVTVNTGGTLAPGASIESLATGALNLADGSSFAVEYNSSGVPTVDVLNVTGNVTLAGSLNLSDLAPVPVKLPLGTKLTIVTYTGTLTGNFAGVLEGGGLTSGLNTFKVRYADGGNAVTLEAVDSVGTPYDSWASSKGLTASNNGQALDPDKDGVSNLLEFYLDGNPLASDGSILPQVSVTPTHLVITLKRRDDAEAQLGTELAQWGLNLTAWNDVVLGATSSGPNANGVTVQVTENGAAPDTIVVSIPRTLSVGGKLFGRVKVAE